MSGVGSEEQVVPLSRLKEIEKQVKQLERVLGKKMIQIEILKKAITVGREKN